jgi:very-short-patch-repair endonuclease
MVKVCKDGRIWGQTNKGAGDHLGILTGRKKYMRKGWNPNSKGKQFKKGHKPSVASKRKMSKNSARHFLGKHHTEESKRKCREAQIKHRVSGKVKFKDTKIEQKIETELKRRNIYYEKQIPLCSITIADFYLPEIRTVIYCDGTYWHSLDKAKQRDINQDLILMFHGFNVYRFTETEINKSPKRCINKIFRE